MGAALYTLFSMAGLAAAVIISRRLRTVPEGRDIPAALAALAGASLGSQVPLWLSYGWGLHGKSYLGGLLGGFLAINLYKLAAGRRRENFGDNFAVGLAAGAGLGKLGCWFNGCCAGQAWGPPPQLLESAFNFAAAFALYRLFLGGGHRGLLFPIYALAYLVMRFFVEFIRAEPAVLSGLTVYQLLALAFIPFFALIIRSRIRALASRNI